MSYAIPQTSLAGLTAGKTGTIDWTAVAQSIGFPDPSQHPSLQLYNESPCELQLNLSTGEQFVLPAGGWQTIQLNANCTHASFEVLAVLNAAPIVALLLGTWFAPGENVPNVPMLGNSPIGGSVVAPTANELIGVGQLFGLTEDDSGGDAPALLPVPGVNTELFLAARDNTGARLNMVELNPVAPEVSILSPASIAGSASIGSGTGTQDFLVYSTGAAVAWENSALAEQHFLPQAGGANWYEFANWTGAAFAVPFAIGSAAGNFLGGPVTTYIKDNGAVGALAGQATSGSFGVPVIVAQRIPPLNVTSAVSVSVITLVNPPTGLYEISGHLNFNNSANQTLTASVSWTDGSTGAVGAQFLSDGTRLFNGVNSIPRNTRYAFQTISVYALNTGSIAIGYTVPGGSGINDFFSACIKRLG